MPTASSALPALSPCGVPRCLIVNLGVSTFPGSITYTSDFNTGSVGNANEVFFQLCDFAPDHTANVSISDPNATSDGLANPLFDRSVPLTFTASSLCPGGVSFDSTLAPELFYTLPRGLVQGGTWTFNVTAGANGWSMDQVSFRVDTYYVQLTPDQSYHLPQDRATVFYQVLSYETQGPVSGSLQFAANGLYVNSTSPLWMTSLPALTPPVGTPQGSLSFLIPSNGQAGTPVALQLWANLTASGRTSSEASIAYITVAQVLAPQLCAATTTDGGPIPCPSPLAFPQGSLLVLRETAVVGTQSAGVMGALPGATITVQLFSAGLPQPAPSSFPTQLTADASGTAREVLDTSVLRVSTITVNVTVTDPNDPALTNHSALTIALLGNSSQVAVVISLNSTQYYGGDTLGGSYQLVMPGGSGGLPPYWTAYAYQIYFLAGATVCPFAPSGALEWQGNLSGVTGPVPSYTLGANMKGIVQVVIFAHNGSSAANLGIYAMTCALVSPPAVLLNPSEVNYLPGDTITVAISGQGTLLTKGNPTYYANVVGFATVTGHAPCSGTTMQVLYGEAVPGTSFSFVVPRNGASTCYEVSVSAETSAGFVSGQDLELDEVSGFQLTASVATLSQYSDGSYQPGQTLSLSYSLTAMGVSSLPASLTLLVQLGTEPPTRSQQASTSGTLSVTIPSGQGAGLLLIFIEAQVTDPSAPGGVLFVSTDTGVMVHPNPSWLDQEVSAGSGFTMGDLTLIVALAAVAAIVFFLWWRSRWERPSQHFHEEHGPAGEIAHTSSMDPSAPPALPDPNAPPPSSDDIAPSAYSPTSPSGEQSHPSAPPEPPSSPYLDLNDPVVPGPPPATIEPPPSPPSMRPGEG